MSYTLHNDQPTLEDKLTREELVKQIADVAATCLPPQVLAVHGDWGAGKTSVLEQVQYRLTGDNRRNEKASLAKGVTYGHVITIWFDAWRYQNEAVPVVALLQEMRRQLGTHLKFIAKTRKLTEVTVRSILSGLDNMAKLIKIEAAPFSSEKIQAAGEKWEKEHLEDRLASDSIQDFLTDTIKALLPRSTGGPLPRLIIIIDDIDRCSPDAAHRFLEGLKNYLILPNCVFLIGMNQQIVTEAIGKIIGKNGNDGDVRLRSEAYLEKMCSNIWRLPFIKNPSSILKEWLSASTKEVGDSIIAEEAKLSLSFLPPNPRRLKSLANLINRIWKKLSAVTAANAETHLKILVVAYIYQFNSELFQRWHYDPNFLSMITGWVNTDSFDKEKEYYFQGLILPTKLKSSDQDVTPIMNCEGAYPDPTAPGIFWIAPLLQKSLSHLTPTDYIEFLRFEDSP